MSSIVISGGAYILPVLGLRDSLRMGPAFVLSPLFEPELKEVLKLVSILLGHLLLDLLKEK